MGWFSWLLHLKSIVECYIIFWNWAFELVSLAEYKKQILVFVVNVGHLNLGLTLSNHIFWFV